MSDTINAFNHQEWKRHNLQDYGDFSDKIAECNQEDRGDHTDGEWFYIPDEPLPVNDEWPVERRVIYNGSWGNFNSPGASTYTYATIYTMDDSDDVEEYNKTKDGWEECPEYLTEYETCAICDETFGDSMMEHDDKTEEWFCQQHSNQRNCVDCDEHFDQDEMIYLDDDKAYLCATCKQNRDG